MANLAWPERYSFDASAHLSRHEAGSTPAKQWLIQRLSPLRRRHHRTEVTCRRVLQRWPVAAARRVLTCVQGADPARLRVPLLRRWAPVTRGVSRGRGRLPAGTVATLSAGHRMREKKTERWIYHKTYRRQSALVLARSKNCKKNPHTILL